MTQKQRSMAIYGAATFILALPLIGMQFSKEVDWSAFDFIIAGTLLFGTAFTVDTILRKVTHNGKRMLFILLALLALFLIWAELAVGIFGSPVAGS